MSGTLIITGTVPPTNDIGVNGDFYLDLNQINLYFKEDSIWGLVANLNGSGTGTVFLTSTGEPAADLGRSGNYCRDVTTQDIYYKAGSAWTRLGSFTIPPDTGTVILTGSSAPSNLIGSNGQYYRNALNQNFYFKANGSWTLIGNLAGSSGGSTAPLTVGEWDMTGTSTPLTSDVAVNCTDNGTNFTVAGSLTGAGPIYVSGVISAPGLRPALPGGVDILNARFTWPTIDGGDNLMGLMAALVNSEATQDDVLEAMFGGSPTHPVWGALAFLSPLGASFYSITNSTHGSPTSAALTPSAADPIFVGLNQSTGQLRVQVGHAGPVGNSDPMNLTGMPANQTLKLMIFAAFSSASPVFLAGSVDYDFTATDDGRLPFSILTDPLPPAGAADGKVYKVTVAGSYKGEVTLVNDYVQFYNALASLIVTRKLDTTALEAQIGVLEGNLTAVAGDLTAVAGDLGTLTGRVDQHDIDLVAATLGARPSLVIDLDEAGNPPTLALNLLQYSVIEIHMDAATQTALSVYPAVETLTNPPMIANAVLVKHTQVRFQVQNSGPSGQNVSIQITSSPGGGGGWGFSENLRLPTYAPGGLQWRAKAYDLDVGYNNGAVTGIQGYSEVDGVVVPAGAHVSGPQDWWGVNNLADGTDVYLVNGIGEVYPLVFGTNPTAAATIHCAEPGNWRLLFTEAVTALTWDYPGIWTLYGAALPTSVAANTLVEIEIHPPATLVCTRISAL